LARHLPVNVIRYSQVLNGKSLRLKQGDLSGVSPSGRAAADNG
jgi:hypothetical protein